jgi:hypothetical protein
MAAKFLIFNNGLKDLCGHYFETAVSVAEAARDLGFAPVLVAHRGFPRDLAPGWLEVHPVCRTDHWMTGYERPSQSEPTPPPTHPLKAVARRLTPPVLRPVLRAVVRRASPAPAAPAIDPLRSALEAAGLPEEVDYLAAAEADLTAALQLASVGRGDVVYLPTAHGREAAAVRRLIGTGRDWPTFHLEFRHALDPGGWPDPAGHPYTRAHRAYFDAVRRSPHPAVRLYTDTEELADEYRRFSGLSFESLPVPFRATLIPERRRTGRRVCLGYVGEVRDEKGFHWLPPLLEEFHREIAAGLVRLVAQATLAQPEYNPAGRAALAALERTEGDAVRLIGRDGPLTPEAYYRELAGMDVLLCPYDPAAYRNRSSGALAEAVAAGLPTVVPAGTWLARQQPPGTGETFTDRDSFVRAVRRVVERYPDYHAEAVAARDRWRATHSPRQLILRLLGRSGQVAASRLAAAG